jgi:hypothetical protein
MRSMHPLIHHPPHQNGHWGSGATRVGRIVSWISASLADQCSKSPMQPAGLGEIPPLVDHRNATQLITSANVVGSWIGISDDFL